MKNFNVLRISAFAVILILFTAIISPINSFAQTNDTSQTVTNQTIPVIPDNATISQTNVTVVPTNATIVPTNATIVPTNVTIVPTNATIVPTNVTVSQTNITATTNVTAPSETEDDELVITTERPYDLIIVGIIIAITISGVVVYIVSRKKTGSKQKVTKKNKFCNKCGALVDPNYKFCKKCGNSVTK